MNKTSFKMIIAKCLFFCAFMFISLNLMKNISFEFSIEYSSEKDSFIKLYYSSEDDSFSEDKSISEKIYTTNYKSKVSYTLDEDDFYKTMISLEKNSIIEIYNIRIKYLGIIVKNFDNFSIMEQFDRNNLVDLDIYGDKLLVTTSEPNPYIGYNELKIDSNIISFINVLLSSFFSILLTIISTKIIKIDKIYKKHIIIFIILSMLILPTILYNFGGLYPSEELENKTLESKPKFTWQTLSTYPNDYENYFSDYIPFKEELVKLNGFVNYHLFDKSPTSSTIKGKENWLFYSPTVADFSKNNLHSEEELKVLKENLLSIQNELNNRDIEFYIIIGPNKNTIYPEYMPNGYSQNDGLSRTEHMLDYLEKETNLNIVNPTDKLLSLKDDYLLYYKWDTHWNEQAGYVAFKELVDKIGLSDIPDFEDLSFTESIRTVGDLKSFMNITPLGNDYSFSTKDFLNDISVEQSSNGNLIYYKSSSSNNQKIMLFRDSFAGSMASYLSKSFEETIFVFNLFDLSIVESESPDIVVYELVERNSYNFSKQS